MQKLTEGVTMILYFAESPSSLSIQGGRHLYLRVCMVSSKHDLPNYVTGRECNALYQPSAHMFSYWK